MAITRIIGCKALAAVAICGAVTGCSSVQTSSNEKTPASADMAATTAPAGSETGTTLAAAGSQTVDAKTVDQKTAGSSTIDSKTVAKSGRVLAGTVGGTNAAPALQAADQAINPAAGQTGGQAAVQTALQTGQSSATLPAHAASKVGRVTFVSHSADPMQRAAETAAVSLDQNVQPVAVPALAVAPTSVNKQAGLTAITMATSRQTIERPVDAAASLTAPSVVAAAAQPALPDAVTGPFAAIPTPRPRIETAGPSSMVAYAAQRQSGSGMAGDFFPPAPGAPLPQTADASPTALSKLIHRYAGLYGVPESLVHRVVHRESKYNPKAYNKQGFWGLMQIKFATAKSMGYDGDPSGLLDAETNLKYAIKYLRGAWLVADNDPDHAIRLYARGYYYDAKRKNMLNVLQ
ncbi:transglycosylase SLT domain-containing protein [Rhizobium sp. SSA_523]|uniref:transglycosylase SLT domain-containing protein n=1 Tax=Rhizobium sp. SSA_523 TaxID=2952477 RepID=UPI002090C1D7|nr:transglycosylase SLT domain-containing protein [Rhizobium sp. SSA_523]MCO5730313.1 transglycosylase SLT domain-containing protein [Rhizobium sp. SSA_523]WKC25365.1 transglycosylase SLT domain-containing protein [Rhizobium sp. SSA_523]